MPAVIRGRGVRVLERFEINILTLAGTKAEQNCFNQLTGEALHPGACCHSFRRGKGKREGSECNESTVLFKA